MNVETEVCKRLMTAFNRLLTDFEVRGNWVSDEGIKGVETDVGPTLEVNVSARKYGGYSSPVAEMTVTLEARQSLSDDTTLDRTVDACEVLTGRLEEWHHDIEAVKRDIAVASRFDPVGFRLDGGNLEIELQTKKRIFTQQFTIKGRILK